MKTCPKCGHSNNTLLLLCAHCGSDIETTPNIISWTRASIGRRLRGAVLSLLVGWSAVVLMVLVVMLTRASSGASFGGILWVATMAAMVSGYMALPAGLIFLPIYLFMPRNWILWRWPIATLCGAVAGASMTLFHGLPPSAPLYRFLAIFAAFTGGITCLFAALTAHRFQDERSA